MQIQLQDGDGKAEFADALFAAKFNEPLVHQVVTAYLAGSRAGTKAQKNRSAVRGGGSKPWRQKGTGRARAGTSRSPLWAGGGKVFAAQPRSHAQKVNRKMYRSALRSVLSELLRRDRLVLVNGFAVDAPKTRALKDKLAALGFDRGLIVVEAFDEKLWLAARNLPDIFVDDVASLEPVSLVAADKVVMTVAAAKILEGRLT
jgi:large subunit ribosomal protein L4